MWYWWLDATLWIRPQVGGNCKTKMFRIGCSCIEHAEVVDCQRAGCTCLESKVHLERFLGSASMLELDGFIH